ncbi:hypothetical protein FRC06_005074, partial [Ceratobasidium sp. 370]
MIARRVAAQVHTAATYSNQNLDGISWARIARIDRGVARGVVPALVDSFGRKHDYLRISLTERCNLRCRYCMPAEGVPLSPSSSILTKAEVVRLARIFVQHGVTKVRLTGGEPTLRHGLTELIQELRELGVKQIGMTNDGIALWRKLPGLVKSGLTHLNLSLDTLDPDKFERMTLRRAHDQVLKSLHTALSLLPSTTSTTSGSGYPHPYLQSVKLNTVLIRNTNDSELARFLALTRSHPLSVRFIEFMPFAGNQWDANAVVTASELLMRTRELIRDGWFDGHPCLFDKKETPLRDLLRSDPPAAEQELIAAVRKAVGGKFAKHGIPNSSFSGPADEHSEGT